MQKSKKNNKALTNTIVINRIYIYSLQLGRKLFLLSAAIYMAAESLKGKITLVGLEIPFEDTKQYILIV